MSTKHIFVIAVIPFLLSAGVIEKEVSFSMEDLTFDVSRGYDVVRLKGCSQQTVMGNPALPVKPVTVLIPPTATVRSIEIISMEKVPVPGTFTILPSQPTPPLSADELLPFAEPNQEIYSMAEEYPGVLMKHVRTGTRAGFRIATIGVYPLQYVPGDKRLYLCTQITFRITLDGGQVSHETAWQQEYEFQREIVRNTVLNTEHVDAWSPPVKACDRSTKSDTRGISFENPEYAIMVSDSFSALLEPLREWKIKKGVATEIFTLEWIRSNYTGVDDTIAVRNFIIDYHQNHGTYYFLCMGDYGVFPMHRRSSMEEDFYYQDYDDDLYSEVYVGRAPVNSHDDIEVFVNKTLAYEREPTTLGFHEKIFLPSYRLFSDYYGHVNDTIAKYDPPSWHDAVRHHWVSYLSTQEISDSFNVGYAYANLSAHGLKNGWGDPGHWNPDAEGLTNEPPRCGVITAICCLIGYIQYPIYDCYVEVMMDNPDGGAVAFWANTNAGYGNMDTKGRSEWLCVWFYQVLAGEGIHNIGKTCAVAKDSAVPYAPLDSADLVSFCMRTLTLFGDPEMPLWTFHPDTLEVAHVEEIPVGTTTVNITVTDDGAPIEGTRVCVWCKQDDIYGVDYTDAAGLVSFTVDPTSGNNDTLYVTVTEKDYRYYEGFIVIDPGPYVVAGALEIDDTLGGNSDALVNPGEDIDLGVWGVDIGRRTAYDVYGILSTADFYVTVTQDSSWYDTVPAQDSILSNPYYEFSLANNCRNGHIIDFTLECHDINDSVWISYPEVTVIAPFLTYQNVDIENDDNANDSLEYGETTDIIVTVKNDGGAIADSVTSTLRTGSSFITINDSTGYHGDIVPESTATNTGDPYNITYHTQADDDTIDFTLFVESGIYIDTLYFSLIVYTPRLAYQDVAVVDDDTGDDMLEPGESGGLVMTIENYGSAPAHSILSTLATTSPDITVHDSTYDFGTIHAGDTVTNAVDPYEVSAGSSTPYFSANDFSLDIEGDAITETWDFDLLVGRFPPSDTGYYYAFYSGGPHIQSPNFEWTAIDSTQSEYPGTALNFAGNTQIQSIDLPFTFWMYGVDRPKVGISCHGWSKNGGGNTPFPENSRIPDPDGPRMVIACVWDSMKPDNVGEPSEVYYYYDEPNHRFIIEYFQMEHYPSGDHETFEIILYDPAYHPTPTGDGIIVVQYLNAPKQADVTIGIEDYDEKQGIQYYHEGIQHPYADPITDSFAIMYTTDPKGVFPRYIHDENDDCPPSPTYITKVESDTEWNVKLTYRTVTTDTLGEQESMGDYIVYMDTTPAFVPTSAESIGFSGHPETTFTYSRSELGYQNTFYLVKAVDWWGKNKSEPSNMGVRFRKVLNENSTTTDKNWTSLTWHSNYATVSDLTDDLSPAGDPLIKITNLRDDQQFESWLWDDLFMEWSGADFAIVPGCAYELITTADTSLLFSGANDPDGLISLNENPDKTDKNWVSIPYNAIYGRARDITDEYCPSGDPLTKLTNLRDDQLFESWLWDDLFMEWSGSNFAIEGGRGYEFVTIVDTIWNPTEYDNQAKAGAGWHATHVSAVEMKIGSSTEVTREPIWHVADGRGHIAKSQEPRAKSQEQRAKSEEPRAESKELRAKSKEQRAKSQERSTLHAIRHTPREAYDADTRESNAKRRQDEYSRKPKAEGPKSSNVVRGHVEFTGCERLVFTAYRPDMPCDVLTERMVGSGVATNGTRAAFWFDAGNFQAAWQHAEEVLVIIEACRQGEVYCNVVSCNLNETVDIQELGVIELVSITELLRTSEHVIGFSEYQENIRLNRQPIALSDLSVAAKGNLRPVIRGGHETVYGSCGPQGRSDQIVPVAYACAVSPNPFADRICIQYALPHATAVDITVYDVTGRVVRTIATGAQEPGSYDAYWYGTDNTDITVAAGVYFIQMKAQGYESQHKVILVH